jgi:hypothetical protein
VTVVPHKLPTTAFALMVLLAIVGVAILFYVCAVAAWAKKVHNI